MPHVPLMRGLVLSAMLLAIPALAQDAPSAPAVGGIPALNDIAQSFRDMVHGTPKTFGPAEPQPNK